MKDKILALTLYLSGLSMNMTGQIIGVSAQSIMRWIQMFYSKYAAIHLPEGAVQEVEIDEMHYFLCKKRPIWIWKFLDHTDRKPVGLECGERSSQTINILCDNYNILIKNIIYTDNYDCYSDMIGA